MATATNTTKGQTTIPKSVRERLRLSPGDRAEFIVQDDGAALMVPATRTLAGLKAAIPAPPRKPGLRDVEDAIHRHAMARTHWRRRASTPTSFCACC